MYSTLIVHNEENKVMKFVNIILMVVYNIAYIYNILFEASLKPTIAHHIMTIRLTITL